MPCNSYYMNRAILFVSIYTDEVPQNFIPLDLKEYKVLKENCKQQKLKAPCRYLPCCLKRQHSSGGKHFSFWFWFGYKNFLLHENASAKYSNSEIISPK